jgi:hypothetical protein
VLFETEKQQQKKKTIFVSIGVLPLLYFVFFYKENFDNVVGKGRKEA